jgi:acyl carrier protein
MNDILQQVSDVVRRSMKQKPGDDHPITPTSKLIDDLNLDSISMVDIVLDLEDRFNITISEAESQAAVTVSELVALVESRRNHA